MSHPQFWIDNLYFWIYVHGFHNGLEKNEPSKNPFISLWMSCEYDLLHLSM